MNVINERVVLEVASDEGLIRQTYFDSVGVATWSIGLTNATGHNVERYWGKPQPLQTCIDVYLWALQRYAAEVNKAFEGYPLTEAQFAAALKFHWNTGAIKTATWVKQWKAGDVTAAKKSFMNYNKPASIVDRRKRERDLFFDGKWSNNGTITEYTKLTAKNTPDWGSGKKIDIRPAIAKAFGAAEPSAQPVTPAPAPAPAPAPVVVASPKEGKSVFNVIGAIFGGIKGAITGATGSAALGEAIGKVAITVAASHNVPLDQKDAPKVAEAIAEAMPSPKAFDPLTPQIFRSALIAAGGALSSRGYIASSDVEMYAGLILTFAPIVWRVVTTLMAKARALN